MGNNFSKSFALAVMAVTKLVCGFAIYKYTSVKYGVEALPILGQALALGALLSFVSSGGISRGLIYALSPNVQRQHDTNKVYLAAGRIFYFSTAILCLLLWFNSSRLSNYLTGSDVLVKYIYILSIAQYFFGLNSIMSAIASARHGQTQLAITSSLAFLVATTVVIAIDLRGFDNLLIYYSIAQGLAVFVILGAVFKRQFSDGFSKILAPVHSFPRVEAKLLLTFSGTLILSTCVIHFVNIFIRVELIENLGLVQAGYWEVAQKLTDGYNQVFGAVLTYMILPYFTRSVGNLFGAFGKVYLVLLATVVLIYLFFSGFGEFVIRLLFSEDAVDAKNVLLLLVVSDIFRIAFTCIQYVMLALHHMRIYVAFELTRAVAIYVAFSFLAETSILEHYAYSLIGVYALMAVMTGAYLMYVRRRT